jgi:NAD/NADP transhydrogenase beta subunit
LRNAAEAVGFVVRRKLQVVGELVGMHGDIMPKMDARGMINLCQR